MTDDVTRYYAPTCIMCSWFYPYCETKAEAQAAVAEHMQRDHPKPMHLWVYSQQLEQRGAELEAELAKCKENVSEVSEVHGGVQFMGVLGCEE